MKIDYSDPLASLATCEEHERGKVFDTCVGRLGATYTIHSYINHKLHIDPQGNLKTIREMTDDFRGLIQFNTFLKTLRHNYPTIFKDIKEAGGHYNE